MVKVDIAHGIYILNNQFNEDTRKDDTFALLASKAVREFSPKANIYVQLCNPEFLRHTWADWDDILCVQTFKMGLFVRNYFVNGYSSFITNLIISSGSGVKKEIESLTWVLEYMHGLSHEIYAIEISKEESGTKFSDLVKQVYFTNGTL